MDLLRQWDGCFLCLEAIARPNFVDNNIIHKVPQKKDLRLLMQEEK
jgi:hypothetical protein